MNLKNKKILYLYTGNHPVHRKMAESLGADILPLNWRIPTNYDIYLSEGDYIKLSVLKIIGKIKKDQKIVVLFSDPRLFYLNEMKKLNPHTQKIEKISKLKLLISKIFIKKLSGTICLSKFEERLLKNIFPKINNITHYPFIEENLFKKLQKVKPLLKNRIVLFIGNGPDWHYKGLDRFSFIASKNPTIKFLVVGGNWESFVKNKNLPKNLIFEGLKKSEQLEKYLQEASLYLHLGRGEAFGVSISEAMAAGIPCIVSNQTGAMEFVEKISSKMVIGQDISTAEEMVKNYFLLKGDEKRKLSKKFKKVSEDLEEKIVLKEYKNKIGDFLNQL